jgi:hypothetical protein
VLPIKFTEMVGLFGWLDTPMPQLFVMAWQALVVALIAIALLVGSRRSRWTLAIVIVASLVVSVAFGSWYRALTDTVGFQGRHLLPIVAAIPLIAGEILYRNSDRIRALSAPRLLVPFASVAGVVQFVAWWSNARRHSHGVNGHVLFFQSPAWSPPLGWPTWLIVVMLAFLLLVGTAVLATREARPAPRSLLGP